MSLFFKIDTDEICVSWSFAIISIISTLAINHADSTLPERQYVWIGHIFIILSLFYLYIRTSTRFIKIRNLGLFFLFVFWYLVTTTYRYSYDASEISFNLSTIAVLLVFSCYDKRVWAYSYTIYYKYMVLMSLLGIIAYISFHNAQVPPRQC